MTNTRKTSRILEHNHPSGPIRIPFVEIQGVKDGPTLAIVAGVHGSEYVGITAAMLLAQEIEPGHLAGTLRIITIANVPGFLQRSMHICPVDGQNLGRCFPGDSNGDYSDALAAAVWEAVAPGTDFLIDVHGGDLEEHLAAYASWPVTGNNKVDELSEQMAHAVDYPLILKKPQGSKPFQRGGLYDAAAQVLGIPAILVEAGSHGELEADLVDLQLGGMTNVMKMIGMLPGEPTKNRKPGYLTNFVSVKAPADGAFYPSVAAGDLIKAGSNLGVLRDFFGTEICQVSSPVDAVVLGIITTTAMPKDAMVAGLGTLADQFLV